MKLLLQMIDYNASWRERFCAPSKNEGTSIVDLTESKAFIQFTPISLNSNVCFGVCFGEIAAIFFWETSKFESQQTVRSIFVHKLCNAHKSRHHKEIKKFSTPKLVHLVYLALSIVDMFLISRQIECTLCCSEKLVTGLELYCKKRCSTLN